MFRVLFLIVGLLFAGANAYGTTCSSTKKNPVTACAVAEEGASGKWHGVWNKIVGSEEDSAALAHLNAPGLCDAKGMTHDNFCYISGIWRPAHWDNTTTTHACYAIFEALVCPNNDCTCPE